MAASASFPMTLVESVTDTGLDIPQPNISDFGAVAATTSSAPAALTSAQITGGQSPTEAEHNALQADVDALRTELAAVQTDAATLRTELNSLRTKFNSVLENLEQAGINSVS